MFKRINDRLCYLERKCKENEQPFQYLFQYILKLIERIEQLESSDKNDNRVEITVRSASTENIDLNDDGFIVPFTSSFFMDQVELESGDIVLLKDQTNPNQNGMYRVEISSDQNEYIRLVRLGDDYYEEMLDNNDGTDPNGNIPNEIRKRIKRTINNDLDLDDIHLGYLSKGTKIRIEEGNVNSGETFNQESQNIVDNEFTPFQTNLQNQVIYENAFKKATAVLVSDQLVPPMYQRYLLYNGKEDENQDGFGTFHITKDTQWFESQNKLFINESSSTDMVIDFTKSCLCVIVQKQNNEEEIKNDCCCEYDLICEPVKKIYLKPGGRIKLRRVGLSLGLIILSYHDIYIIENNNNNNNISNYLN